MSASVAAVESIPVLAMDYEFTAVGKSLLIKADSFEWMSRLAEGTLHAVVTDPPYGVKEYDADQLEKRANGNGGIWRIPPSFDGHKRAPLPRFTALDASDRARMREFFFEWAKVTACVLRPGGHVFIASNAITAQLVFSALAEGGLEFRGEVIRLVRTLRGGDRPKNAEAEFPDVQSMARGCYEPWGVFRKPLPSGMRVSDCLRLYGTGGLRRSADGKPFTDVIVSERTTQAERQIADHPSLKPQSFLRRLVHAALPLGRGVIADPFMGSGSTIAAAEAMGLSGVGVERLPNYYALAVEAVPRLRNMRVTDAPEHRLPAGEQITLIV